MTPHNTHIEASTLFVLPEAPLHAVAEAALLTCLEGLKAFRTDRAWVVVDLDGADGDMLPVVASGYYDGERAVAY